MAGNAAQSFGTDRETRSGSEVRAVRVLILEDDPFIGLDLQSIVEAEGHEVVRWCGSVAQAREALGSKLDFVLLDVEVRDGTSYEFAAQLSGRRIPFAFVSGSKRKDVPQHLQGAPFIAKPFMEAAIKGVLPKQRGRSGHAMSDAGSVPIGEERRPAA